MRAMRKATASPQSFHAPLSKQILVVLIRGSTLDQTCMGERESYASSVRRCFHGEPATRRQVLKPGSNKGRFFWACARTLRSGKRCAYFVWDSHSGVYETVQAADGARTSLGDQVQADPTSKKLESTRGRVPGAASSRTCGSGPFWEALRNTKRSGTSQDQLPQFSLSSDPQAGSAAIRAGSGLEKRPSKERAGTQWLVEIGDGEHFHLWPQKNSEANAYMLFQLAQRVPGAVLEPSKERLRIPLSSWTATSAAVAALEGSIRGHPPQRLMQNLVNLRRRLEDRNGEKQCFAEVLAHARASLASIQLWEQLLPFQRTGVERAIVQGGRVLLADEMGLGKTIQAIAIAWVLRKDWPVLIVCPSSLRGAWCREWRDRLAGASLTPSDIHVLETATDAGKPLRAVNIVSYDLVGRLADAQLQRVGVLILDESHYIKSVDAKRTQFLLPWLKRIPRVLLLTGTPALSRPAELFTQLHGLAPSIFSDWKEFAYRYCGARSTPWKALDTSGATNLSELHRILTQTVMIRRLKAEILDQLPRKERGVAYVEPAASTPEQLHAVLDELAATEQKASTGDQQAASKVKALMSKAFHLTAVAKVPAVLAQCADIWRTGHKFLLFAYHELMLDAVEGWLREQQGTWIRIDGKTQVTERQALVDRFQDDPQCRVALLALTAAGAGLTLTAAHVVLFAELYWNPGTLRQAEDRVHRIGQKESVSIRYLILPRSLDDRMWRSVQNKLDILHSSLDGKIGRERVNVVAGSAWNAPEPGPLDRFFKRRSQGVVSSPEPGADEPTSVRSSSVPDAFEQDHVPVIESFEQEEPPEIPSSFLNSELGSGSNRTQLQREARKRTFQEIEPNNALPSS